jgi:hypothetical protein
MSSKNRGTPVDMSLPPEQRRRKRQQGRIVVTPPAQMDHGTSPRGRAQARRGEKWLAVQEAARKAQAAQVAPAGVADHVLPLALLPADEAEPGNVVIITRELGQELHDDAG